MIKILIIASLVKKHISVFHLPYLKMYKDNGYEVHVASKNDYDNSETFTIPNCDKFFDLNFKRNPIHPSNVLVLLKLRSIIKKNSYDIIHCHTPIGGFLGRIAALSITKVKSRMVYTAHGFHFYKNSPLYSWLFFYPVERFLSRFTDILITINQEDYKLALTRFKAKRTLYIPGVGINLSKFYQNKTYLTKKDLGINDPSFVLLSVGELNKNKNHQVILMALSKLNNLTIHYIICGEGALKKKLMNLSEKLLLSNNVHFLGFREDVHEIYRLADVFVFPSYREGLSVAMMEAMASKLPIICSNIRGNIDLIDANKGGFLAKPNDVDKFYQHIYEMYRRRELLDSFGEYNSSKIIMYSLEKVLPLVDKIYHEVI